MAGDLCPYCNTLLTTSLKFCVNCRRSVTEDKIKQASAMDMGGGGRDDDEPQSKYRLSRKSSYDSLRQSRTFFLTLTTLISIALVYYCTMKFVLHEPVPFEQEITSFVQEIMNRAQQPVQPTQPGPMPQ